MTDPIAEAIGHLGAALLQSVSADDQIIMHHVKLAHDLLTAHRDDLRRRATLPRWPDLDGPACTICFDTGRERYQLGPLSLVRPCPACPPSETVNEALERVQRVRANREQGR